MLIIIVLHGLMPKYLGPLNPVADLPGSRYLRASDTSRLVVPSVKLSTDANRAFRLSAHESGTIYQLKWRLLNRCLHSATDRCARARALSTVTTYGRDAELLPGERVSCHSVLRRHPGAGSHHNAQPRNLGRRQR